MAFRLLFLALGLLAFGCGRSHLVGGATDEPRPVGGDSDAGHLPAVGTARGPCGSFGEQCCLGAACDEGLACGDARICCSVPGGAACESDFDCCGGLSCIDNECLVDRGGSCFGSSDCADGLICEVGVCGAPPPGHVVGPCGARSEPCCLGAACDEGLLCSYDGHCRGAPGAPCVSDVDCPSNVLCIRNTCVSDACYSDAECDLGFLCTENECVPL